MPGENLAARRAPTLQPEVRLPLASFVPASKRTALVRSSGSEHLANWPRGFRSGRRLSRNARRWFVTHSQPIRPARPMAI